MFKKSLLAALCLISALTAQAAPKPPPITITQSQLPFTISAPGTYVLTGDLNFTTLSTGTTGPIPAIAIANNVNGAVVVDFKGFTITGGGELDNTAVSYGVVIGNLNTPLTNTFPITIKNGTLTNFYSGIDASQGGHGGLTRITIDGLTISHPGGAAAQARAIIMEGALNTTFTTISNCNIQDYDFGIWTNFTTGTGSVANNSYRNITFTSITTPFLFSGGNGIGKPITLNIEIATEQLEIPQ
jgi:hypothetical protein